MAVIPTPEDVLNLHPKIRWAGLASELGEVIWMKQREGLESYSPEHTDRAFVQTGQLIVSGVCERMSSWTGGVRSIVIDYEKVITIVTKLKSGHLCLTLDKNDAQHSIPQVLDSLQKWKH